MSYSSLRDAVNDLERNGQLIRIKEEVDPNLEMAEIHFRINDKKGPALLFENVKGSPFQAVSNIYGTPERTRFLFRDTIARVERLMEIKADPGVLMKKPLRYAATPFTALKALPQKSIFSKPILYKETTIDQLPQIKSWPMDGGAFVTLPQVYTESPDKPGVMQSNLGMYRIQLSGNDYIPNQEIGLHYQLHRGIGVHHTRYNELDKPFRCSIFVGGPPSHAFSAIMPLPEGMSELMFAGLLGGRRFRYCRQDGFTLSSDADFVITGIIEKDKRKPEGPFGDHLGYYSLTHQFPVLKVHKVWHRRDALWHFTAVGRPPQEDSSFGYLIHELVKTLTPKEFPGLKELNAVDAAGVHPLLLAIGYERYMPFRESKPEEILTIANKVLGTGQTSLAKYLFIAAGNDHPELDTHDIPAFFKHILERIDWSRDLHFQTRTTIDTLDYSGSGWNEGSKVVIACCGPVRRQLAINCPVDLSLPEGFDNPRIVLPGILAIQGSKFSDYEKETEAVNQLANRLGATLNAESQQNLPLIILCDDSSFVSATLNNFLWATFTRSNPASDIYGVKSSVVMKHWGCKGPLIIDARKKPHHAPELIPDPLVSKKVDELFSRNKELGKWG